MESRGGNHVERGYQKGVETGIEDLVSHLAQRRAMRGFPVAVRPKVKRLADQTLGLLFPHFTESANCSGNDLRAEVDEIQAILLDLTRRLWPDHPHAPNVAEAFLEALPQVDLALSWDAEAIHQGDPASESIDEVIATYPGFFAIGVYRLAHVLYDLGFPVLPRLLTEYAHRETGIDIHPGATIGRGFVIDHGTGIVIGETTRIGNQVKLYQGVTLGAISVEKAMAETKRHPTLEDHVVVYANATILGGRTTIGHDSIIGGNAWITDSVPAYSLVSRHSEVRPRKPGGEPELDFFI